MIQEILEALLFDPGFPTLKVGCIYTQTLSKTLAWYLANPNCRPWATGELFVNSLVTGYSGMERMVLVLYSWFYRLKSIKMLF